jgi:hypothetical protein
VGTSLKKIGVLKTQIEGDAHANPKVFERQKQRAIQILEDLVLCGTKTAEAMLLVPQLKRSITDFYDPKCNRPWAQRFVLQDLQKLEDHWSKNPEMSETARKKWCARP